MWNSLGFSLCLCLAPAAKGGLVGKCLWNLRLRDVCTELREFGSAEQGQAQATEIKILLPYADQRVPASSKLLASADPCLGHGKLCSIWIFRWVTSQGSASWLLLLWCTWWPDLITRLVIQKPHQFCPPGGMNMNIKEGPQTCLYLIKWSFQGKRTI